MRSETTRTMEVMHRDARGVPPHDGRQPKGIMSGIRVVRGDLEAVIILLGPERPLAPPVSVS